MVPLVVYWPPTRPNMPFQRRWKCIFHWRGRAWLTIWDRVKIPRYSHKLMHRKRVTCELHDSYFRSMTIKHATPKTAEVHKILSGRELLYNWVQRKFNQLETRCGRKSQHPAEGALRLPINEFWGSEEMEIWCCSENSTQEIAGSPGLRLSSPRERERNANGLKSGGQCVAVLIGLQLPLTHTAFKLSERYIFWRTVLLVLVVSSLWFRMHAFVFV